MFAGAASARVEAGLVAATSLWFMGHHPTKDRREFERTANSYYALSLTTV
jgi:hypothetical protein